MLGPVDETAPHPQTLRLSTLTPDFSRRARTVRVRAVAWDDLAVRSVHLLLREFTHGRQHDEVWLIRTAGNAKHGT